MFYISFIEFEKFLVLELKLKYYYNYIFLLSSFLFSSFSRQIKLSLLAGSPITKFALDKKFSTI